MSPISATVDRLIIASGYRVHIATPAAQVWARAAGPLRYQAIGYFAE